MTYSSSSPLWKLGVVGTLIVGTAIAPISQASAQIIPDNTLGSEASTVIPNQMLREFRAIASRALPCTAATCFTVFQSLISTKDGRLTSAWTGKCWQCGYYCQQQNNQSFITAETASGSGGNIQLELVEEVRSQEVLSATQFFRQALPTLTEEIEQTRRIGKVPLLPPQSPRRKVGSWVQMVPCI